MARNRSNRSERGNRTARRNERSRSEETLSGDEHEPTIIEPITQGKMVKLLQRILKFRKTEDFEKWRRGGLQFTQQNAYLCSEKKLLDVLDDVDGPKTQGMTSDEGNAILLTYLRQRGRIQPNKEACTAGNVYVYGNDDGEMEEDPPAADQPAKCKTDYESKPHSITGFRKRYPLPEVDELQRDESRGYIETDFDGETVRVVLRNGKIAPTRETAFLYAAFVVSIGNESAKNFAKYWDGNFSTGGATMAKKCIYQGKMPTPTEGGNSTGIATPNHPGLPSLFDRDGNGTLLEVIRKDVLDEPSGERWEELTTLVEDDKFEVPKAFQAKRLKDLSEVLVASLGQNSASSQRLGQKVVALYTGGICNAVLYFSINNFDENSEYEDSDSLDSFLQICAKFEGKTTVQVAKRGKDYNLLASIVLQTLTANGAEPLSDLIQYVLANPGLEFDFVGIENTTPCQRNNGAMPVMDKLPLSRHSLVALTRRPIESLKFTSWLLVPEHQKLLALGGSLKNDVKRKLSFDLCRFSVEGKDFYEYITKDSPLQPSEIKFAGNLDDLRLGCICKAASAGKLGDCKIIFENGKVRSSEVEAECYRRINKGKYKNIVISTGVRLEK